MFLYYYVCVVTCSDVSSVAHNIYKSNIKKRPILLYDLIKLFETNTEFVKINAHVKADGYLRSLKEDKKLV